MRGFSGVLFTSITVVSMACTTTLAVVMVAAAPPHCQYPAIYNFGDSNSDTGGISAAFVPQQPPNGETFFKHPAGRSSDGRLVIDFIAEQSRLPHLSAYLDSIGANFRHGANFATGGSTIRRQNETIFQNGISPFSLDIQIIQFDQFRARTNDLYNQGKRLEGDRLPRPEDFAKALYTFDIGQNDLSVGFRTMSYEQQRYTIPDIVNKFASAIEQLYQKGARTFWIHNTGPVGCLPVALFYVKDPKPGYLDQNGCIKAHNDMAVEFNTQLKNSVLRLRKQLPNAALVYVDVYTAKYKLISDAHNQGFMNPFKVCCGRHEDNVHVWCGQRANVNNTEAYGGTCGNPTSYISWDGVHFTEAANHWLANNVLSGSLSEPLLIPVSRACLVGGK